MKIFNESYGWLKGNLHMHTSKSDGKLPPEKAIQMYAKEGYDFVAVTDHGIYTSGEERDDLLVLSGIECTCDQFHIVGVGMKEPVECEDDMQAQDIIDEIIEAEGIPIVAHPVWSLLDHQDFFELSGFIGAEIWNSLCAYTRRGDAAGYLDVILAGSVTPLLFAVDDTHYYKKELYSGWIAVNCKSAARDDIMESIAEKRFFCSQGPLFEQIWVEGDRIRVKTTPVAEIRFMTARFSGKERIQRGKGITEAAYIIDPNDIFVRIECSDSKGKTAWSQVVWESII
jgi:hypothetical protein